MKLFKSLLVAPATLGLLAPVAATANEVTINDFNAAEEIAVTNSRVDGLEARLNDFEAGSFSETTTASFGTTFYVGTVDAGDEDGVTTFTYDFGLDLETSFTGEDSLEIAIIGGNAMGGDNAVDDYMDGDGTGDVLTLDGIAYTFPLGGFTITTGDEVGADEQFSGACAYSSFTDLLGDCGTGEVGGAGESGVSASYDFGNGLTFAAGIAGGGQSAAVAALNETVNVTGANAEAIVVEATAEADTAGSGDTTALSVSETTAAVDAAPLGLLSDQDESTVAFELAYTADTFALSAAYTDDDNGDGSEATFYSFQAAFTPDAPYSISAGFEFDDDEDSSYFVGVTSEVGVGELSVGMATQGLAADHADNLQYELAYSYPINDGMTITPGVFIAEDAVEDEFGFVVTTSFSF